MIDYVAAFRSESARFSELLRLTDPEAPVPSCPGWSASDLFWHLTEVQYFWATIVAGLLDGPEAVAELVRPSDGELGDLFDAHSARLLQALRDRTPSDECWSWHDSGGNVGWVRRRQAHEALIHRVDAELAAGNAPVVDATLAEDGIDEVLAVYLDASQIPEWASFHRNDSSARLTSTGGASWTVELGRFVGTSPNTGNTYDDPALRLGNETRPDLDLVGAAADLDLWLWGRGSLDPITVTGDRELAEFVRAAAAAGTQ